VLAHGWQTILGRGVVRSCEPFTFWWAPTISLKRLKLELSRGSSQVLLAQVDGKCDKLVTVDGHQFITLTVYICIQHGGRETPRRAGLPAAVGDWYSFGSCRLTPSTVHYPL